MATVVIQKRKGKKRTTYSIRYYDPITGNKKYYRSFKTYAEAKIAESDLCKILEKGKSPEIIKRKRVCEETFSKIADSLIIEWNDRLMLGELSKKTVAEYSIFMKVLIKQFGDKPFHFMGQKEISEFCLQKALKFSNIAHNKYLSIFRKLYQHAIKMNVVDSDITSTMTYLSEKNHIRNRFLLPEELNRLVSASKKNRSGFYLPALIYLGAEHGASKQESLSLRWCDIDFNYSKTGLIKFYRTKNKNQRTELLMSRTKEALLEWKEHLLFKRKKDRINDVELDYVFCRINSGDKLENFSRAWKRALKEANIDNFHFHDLRHTFCSNLILAGAGLKDVKEMIGHSDISMTDRYSHLTMDHKAQKQKLLEQHYSNQL